MSVPAFKNAKAKVRRRRSHHALKKVQSSTCVKCSAPIISHRACAACGYYNGRQAVKAKESLVQKAETNKEEKKTVKKGEKAEAKKTAKKQTKKTK